MPLNPHKLKAAREKRKLTQAQVGQRAGLAQPNYAKIEAGARTDPRLSTAERIARAVDARLDRLLLHREDVVLDQMGNVWLPGPTPVLLDLDASDVDHLPSRDLKRK